MQILEYVDAAGDSPYRDSFESLDAQAAAKVTVALTRIELGNLSNVKGVGAGVQEFRIDFGPGYRVYFVQRGKTLVVLLCGGDKSDQARDIRRAIMNDKSNVQTRTGYDQIKVIIAFQIRHRYIGSG